VNAADDFALRTVAKFGGSSRFRFRRWRTGCLRCSFGFGGFGLFHWSRFVWSKRTIQSILSASKVAGRVGADRAQRSLPAKGQRAPYLECAQFGLREQGPALGAREAVAGEPW